MKGLIRASQLLGGFLIALIPQLSLGQTVSILTISAGGESLMVESAMKRHLRAEGFTAKGGTNEGYVLLLSVVPATDRAGYSLGVAGNIMVGNVDWQDLADKLVSEACHQEHMIAQFTKDLLGARIIFIDSNMAIAQNEERLAEMLSTFATKAVRNSSNKMAKFFREAERRSSEKEPLHIEQYR